MAGNGQESTSIENSRFSGDFDDEDSFDDEGMEMGAYAEDFGTRPYQFEPMAKKKAGAEFGEEDDEKMVDPRDSGEIGRLQNVEWLVSFGVSHRVWSKNKRRCRFL